LRQYGSVPNLKRATVEELSRVVSKKIAEKIVSHYRNGGVSD